MAFVVPQKLLNEYSDSVMPPTLQATLNLPYFSYDSYYFLVLLDLLALCESR